jgi:uncharacterized coiled-coil protein SlyX
MTDEQLPLTPIGRKVVEPSHRLSNEDWARVVAEAAEIRRQQEQDAAAAGDDETPGRRLGAGLLQATAPAPRKLAPIVNLTAAGRACGKYFPVSGIPTQLIVFHSMECPLQAGYARSLTNWALTPESAGGPQASWHRGYGPDERVYFIPDELGAWHASEANPLSIGLEQTGYAAYTRAQWLTPDGYKMLDSVAADVAAICKRDGIPARWLTTAEVRAVLDGGNRSIKGFCYHRQVDPETRTDPGNGYPADVVLAKIKSYLGAAPAPSTEGTIVGASEVSQIKSHINAVLLGPYSWSDGTHPAGVRGDVLNAVAGVLDEKVDRTGPNDVSALQEIADAKSLGLANQKTLEALAKAVADQGKVLAAQQQLLARISEQVTAAVTAAPASPPATPPAT